MIVNAAQQRATIDDLYDVDEPAELINGVIVRDLTGVRPGEVAANIYVSLRGYAKSTKRGKAYLGMKDCGKRALGILVFVLLDKRRGKEWFFEMMNASQGELWRCTKKYW